MNFTEIPPCTGASVHCLHDTGKIMTGAAGGWHPQELICCHCGKHVTSWQGGTIHFHGPYAPENQLKVGSW
jgi:hypothetical protein